MDSVYYSLAYFSCLFLVRLVDFVGADHDCNTEEEKYDIYCREDIDVIMGSIVGGTVAILLIAAISTIICVKCCCKNTRHGAIITPSGGNTNQITHTQSTNLQARGFSSTHTYYSTPSAPPMIWSFSQNNEPQPTGYSEPSSYSGTGTRFGDVPPPPTYDESVSNNPLPPKYWHNLKTS